MKIGFCGCSITHGEGVEPDQTFAAITAELLDCDYKKYSEGGASNQQIFHYAVDALTSDCDTVIVQWTSSGRQYFLPQYGRRMFSKNKNSLTVDFVKQRDWNTFSDVYRLVDNDFNQYELLHTAITQLNTLAQQLGKQVYYMNGLVYIDPQFLTDESVNYAELPEPTRLLLAVDALPDTELKLALRFIRRQLAVIDSAQWINIECMQKIDRGTDDLHPGAESHRQQAHKIVKFIQDKRKQDG